MSRQLALLAGASLLWSSQVIAQVAITRIDGDPGSISKKGSLTINIQDHDWVVDIGTCTQPSGCISNFVDPTIGNAMSFDFLASDTIQQGDVAMGEGHWASNGTWDVSGFDSYNFTFRDRNAPGLYHYALMYDDRKCYRQWLFNHPDWNNGHQLKSGTWYSVSASLGNNQFKDFYTQDGGSLDCYVASGFNFGAIKYIEFGIFGPAVDLNGEYGFDIGAQLTFAKSTIAPAPEPMAWVLMILGFGIAGCGLRDSRASKWLKTEPV